MRMKVVGFSLSAMLFALCFFGALHLAFSVPAQAQQKGKVPRVGHITGHSPSDVVPTHKAFYRGLRELGYIEGKNIIVENRYTEGNRNRYPDFVAELVRLKIDVIVSGSPRVIRLAKKATSTIPIVMPWTSDDPVTMGLVASLARPGGNITGLTSLQTELNGKRLELFKEVSPQISRIAVLYIPTRGSGLKQLNEVKVAARALNIQVHPVKVQRPADFDTAFSEITKEQTHALFVIRTSFMRRNARKINSFAVRSQLPTMWDTGRFVAAGGLMSYGADAVDMYRRAATYVDKILKGAKPADLPIEQPRKFVLTINLKTAKKLGLTIPPEVLYRADKVIR